MTLEWQQCDMSGNITAHDSENCFWVFPTLLGQNLYMRTQFGAERFIGTFDTREQAKKAAENLAK